ncbi:MAG: type II toxin-antitoxin system RelE/ParE family toxin [Alphaproteobacteria bacterium]|jgi:phage-related protein|nr:type II toxin-antitoxin system RelE/ParE family toxin [Alphaproteobacteria bacterium]
MPSRDDIKPCFFMGSSQRDLGSFPDDARGDVGHALYEAQCGEEPFAAKAMKGFGGRSVLEIVADSDGDTFRAVYTVRFADAIYVLHAFQKKSKRGIATPQRDIELIRTRLKAAEEHHRTRQKD